MACRLCRHYQFEGRRGGQCTKLGVPVQGAWSSCELMTLSLSKPKRSPLEFTLRSEHYVSEIYSYETAAKLKSTPHKPHAQAS